MRYPAQAGRFYPGDRDGLIEEIEFCFNHSLGPGKISGKTGKREIVGALCPHAGYRCSGMNAAHVFKKIAEDGLPEAYVIIGPDHYGIPYDVAMCSESYLTPLGECEIHSEISEKLSKSIIDSPRSHEMEHSVEVEVPFIQYIDPKAKIVPIIMRDQRFETAKKLGRKIADACKGIDAIVIASSDLSHYVPKELAEKNDKMVLDALGEMNMEKMYYLIDTYDITACGYGPIAAALEASKAKSVEILAHTDSYDALDYGKESVVGYGSAVMRNVFR